MNENMTVYFCKSVILYFGTTTGKYEYYKTRFFLCSHGSYNQFTAGADPGILIRGGVTFAENIGVLGGQGDQGGIAPCPSCPPTKVNILGRNQQWFM